MMEDVEDAIRFLERIYGGGTHFFSAFEKAEGVMRSKQCMEKADIAFITDGQCRFDQHQLDKLLGWKKDLGFRIFSIVILASITQAIKDISDEYVRIEDMVLDGKAVDLYGRI